MDAVLRLFKPRLLPAGLLDESAHIATTLILGGPSVERRDPVYVAGALIGSVLIDADHVPPLVLKRPLESAEDRPATHSLATLLVVSGCSLATRNDTRAAMLGVTFGTTSHLIRDLATGGIPLCWPFSRRLATIPYPVYALVICGLVVRRRSLSLTES